MSKNPSPLVVRPESLTSETPKPHAIPAPMIDWLSGFFSIRDPGGASVDPRSFPRILGDTQERYDRETGEVIACGFTKRRIGPMEGCGAFAVDTRIVGSEILISGNLNKFVQGHGIFSPLEPWESVDAWGRFLLERVGVPADHFLHLERLTRIDLAQEVDCDSRECGHATLATLKVGWSCPRKPLSIEANTVYLGKRSGGWTIKAYRKALDPKRGPIGPGLPDVSEFLRLEACLRPDGMRQFSLDPRAPRESDLGSVFADVLSRCRLANGNLEAPMPPPGLSRGDRCYWRDWLDGRDMKALLPSSSYYRARQRLLDHEIDISRPPPALESIARIRPLSWGQIQDPTRWHATRFTLSHLHASRLLRAHRLGGLPHAA